jgi:Tfp pilus assembly protein PilO
MRQQLKLLQIKIAAMPFFNSPIFLKHSRLIVPGIVLVVALLIASLITIPQFLKLFETFRTIEELNTKKAFYQRKISELESLDIVGYRKDLETALIALPVDKDITGITGELLVALSGSGMSLGGITFGSDTPGSEKVQEYTLKMDVTGSSDNLRNFLERVKLSPRIIKLESIDVSRGKGNLLAASLGFVTLYQQLPQHIGAVDENVPQIATTDLQVLADIEAKIKSLPQISPTEASTSAIGKLDPFSN